MIKNNKSFCFQDSPVNYRIARYSVKCLAMSIVTDIIPVGQMLIEIFVHIGPGHNCLRFEILLIFPVSSFRLHDTGNIAFNIALLIMTSVSRSGKH